MRIKTQRLNFKLPLDSVDLVDVNALGLSNSGTYNTSNGGGTDFFSKFITGIGAAGNLWTQIASGWSNINASNNPPPQENKSNTGLYIGIGVVALVLILLVVMFVSKRNNG